MAGSVAATQKMATGCGRPGAQGGPGADEDAGDRDGAWRPVAAGAVGSGGLLLERFGQIVSTLA
jgi:hypothetical protein